MYNKILTAQRRRVRMQDQNISLASKNLMPMTQRLCAWGHDSTRKRGRWRRRISRVKVEGRKEWEWGWGGGGISRRGCPNAPASNWRRAIFGRHCQEGYGGIQLLQGASKIMSLAPYLVLKTYSKRL